MVRACASEKKRGWSEQRDGSFAEGELAARPKPHH
jgi:hypothetical protein